DYESAIISGAFCGFAMGATATAIANMQALTRRHGPAPQAFVVVPSPDALLPPDDSNARHIFRVCWGVCRQYDR
ncbi:MAG: sodium/glutamate symporter, partial [Stellaceae bacterium]